LSQKSFVFQLAKYLNGAAELQKSPDYPSFHSALKDDVNRAAKILNTTDLWLLPTMNPGVNFSNIFKQAFCEDVFCAAFMCFWYEILIFW